MPGTTLGGRQIVQGREPCPKRLLAAFGMLKPFQHEQLPVDGVVGLIQQCARHRHPGVCEDRLPARLLVLEPLPYACAVGRCSRGGDVVRKAAHPLAQRTHP